MRFQRASVVGSIAAVLAMGMAYGQGYLETFGGYTAPSSITQWYSYSDWTYLHNPVGYDAYVQDGGQGTGNVGGANVGNFPGLDYFDVQGGVAQAQDVYFATNASSLPGAMSAMISIDEVVDNSVTGVYYYFLTDTNDFYYTDLTVLNTSGVLTQYGSVSTTDAALGAWYLYVEGGPDVAVAEHTDLYSLFEGQVIQLGIGVSFGDFTAPVDIGPPGESYAALNFDNIMVPEPSALVLAGLGLVGLLGRRARRRQAA